MERVEFLGHVVEGGKIYPSPDKTAAVMNFPRPASVKEMQRFLDLTGYFHKFIDQYSLLTKPLSDILKADAKFQFEIAEERAFRQPQTALSQHPVLKIYHPSDRTELHTDASGDGYGSVLL